MIQVTALTVQAEKRRLDSDYLNEQPDLRLFGWLRANVSVESAGSRAYQHT